MRNALLVSIGALVLSALAACGPAEPAREPAAPKGSAAPAASSAVASSAPSVSATPGPPRPELRFWSFDGPAEGPAITGKRGWTAVADGKANDRYRHVFISVEGFVKADGTSNHWSAPYGDIVSPLAMGANLAPPAALKKGDPILADNSNDSAFGRVVSVAGETVTLKYVFGDLAGELEAPLAEVLLLDGSLRLGTPVAFKQESKWYTGRLLARTAQDAWIGLHYSDNQPYAKAKAEGVRALDLRVLKVGDKCLADSSYASKNELVPATVTKVVEDGIFYEVKTEKGATWTVPFDHVTAPL